MNVVVDAPLVINTKYAPDAPAAAVGLPLLTISTVGVFSVHDEPSLSKIPQLTPVGFTQYVLFAAEPVGSAVFGLIAVKSTSARTMYAAEL